MAVTDISSAFLFVHSTNQAFLVFSLQAVSPVTGFPFCSYCRLSQNWTFVSRIPHEISQCIT